MTYCPTESRHYISIPYSEVLGEQIIDRMYRGERISQIIESMPPLTLRTFYEWRASNQRFDDKIKVAKRAQGELRADRVLDLADDAASDTSENKPNYSAAISAYQWAAEKSDPDTFGKRQAMIPQAPVPPQIVILTGLPSPQEAQLQREVWLKSIPQADSVEAAKKVNDEEPE